MEKSWMPGLLDALQAPRPKEPDSEESVAEEPVSRQPNISVPRSDSFGGGTEGRWAPPREESNFNFSGGTDSRWSPATKPVLDDEGSRYWNESWSDRVLAHAPAITVAVLLLVALGALSFFYRVQTGQSLVRLGEMLSGQRSQSSVPNPGASTVQPATPPVSSPPLESRSPQPPGSSSDSSAASAPSSADADAATNPAVSSAKGSEGANARSNQSVAAGSRDPLRQRAAEESTLRTSAFVDNGQDEFRIADASLQQAHTPQAKAKAAELLWAAVSKGSTDAEVELADVYGRGAGVRKNCQQARILLAAAGAKSNPLVGRESSELRVYGCR